MHSGHDGLLLLFALDSSAEIDGAFHVPSGVLYRNSFWRQRSHRLRSGAAAREKIWPMPQWQISTPETEGVDSGSAVRIVPEEHPGT
jgi:hypothetical protein